MLLIGMAGLRPRVSVRTQRRSLLCQTMIWRSDCLLKPVVTRYLPLQAHTIRALFMATMTPSSRSGQKIQSLPSLQTAARNLLHPDQRALTALT